MWRSPCLEVGRREWQVKIFDMLYLHHGSHYRMPMEECTMLIIATCVHSGRDPRQALHRIAQHHRWPGIGIGRGCTISTPCGVPLLREDKTTITQYVTLCVCVYMCVCVYVCVLCVRACARVCVRMHMCVCVVLCVYVCVVCTYVCVSVSVCLCLHMRA